VNRLHPRVRVVWAVQAAVTAVVVGLVVFGVSRFALSLPVWAPVAAFGVFLVAGVGLALLRYRVWRYEVRDDALYLERGVFTRVRTVVPFVRIQHVDSSRGPVERLVGLASTVVYTAGSRGADVTVPGLTSDGADGLRERLKRLAIRAEGEDAV
jgi:membrane protein YdbS with pleckstrin-like domain